MSKSINQRILDERSIIRDHYSGNHTLDNDYVTVEHEPFKIIKLKKLLDEKYMQQLSHVLDNIMMFYRNNDMYRFKQSQDLKNESIKPLQKFIHILTNEMKPLICNLMGVELNNNISITSSLYEYGDMLLCHDDKCEDRCVAFVYYLNSGSDNSGGNFDMFNSDSSKQPGKVVKSIPPEANSFLFFEVGDLTFHQVSEVTNPSFKRLSINGWFHTDKLKENNPTSYKLPQPMIFSQVNVESSVPLHRHMNPLYCQETIIENMTEDFEGKSFLLLEKIFNTDFYQSCKKCVESNLLEWKKVGPPNRRWYEITDITKLTGELDYLVKSMMSPTFIEYLNRVTCLSLKPMEGSNPGSQFTFELIRWCPGSYTLLSDDDEFYKKPGLDLYIFFGSIESDEGEPSGCIHYLTDGEIPPDEEVENDDGEHADVPPVAHNSKEEDANSNVSDEEVLTIQPVDNSLTLAYRKDVVRFTKYNSLKNKKPYYAIYATYYELE